MDPIELPPEEEEDPGFKAMPEQESEEDTAPSEGVKEGAEETPPVTPGEGGEVPPAEKPEKPVFGFVEKPPGEEPSQPTEPLFVDYNHQGQPFRLNVNDPAQRQRLVDLAQKGHDYDVKVGPDGNLVKLVNADPFIGKTLNQYFQHRMEGLDHTAALQAVVQPPEGSRPVGDMPPVELRPEFKPMTAYKDENEWLQDNFQRNVQPLIQGIDALRNLVQDGFQRFQENPPVAAAPQTEEVDPSAPFKNMLAGRDPENAATIIPKLAEYKNQLTIGELRAITGDSTGAELCRFYDWVKADVQAQQAQPPAATTVSEPVVPPVSKVPPFRVHSGGGTPPLTPKDEADKVWEESDADFEGLLNKLKYGKG